VPLASDLYQHWVFDFIAYRNEKRVCCDVWIRKESIFNRSAQPENRRLLVSYLCVSLCNLYIASGSTIPRSFILACGLVWSQEIAWQFIGATLIEVVQLYFACFKAGLIAVPLNNRLKAPEIAYILRHSRAKICFSQPELVDLCEEVWGECPDLQILTSSLPSLDAREAPRLALSDVTPDQVAAIMYTSGTTARPKEVMHTHISLIGATEMMCSLGISEASSLLAVSQLMHIAALVCVLLPGISRGSAVVLLPAFEAGQLLDLSVCIALTSSSYPPCFSSS
jgi:acyl-CoA synthetase (AMP-forming)/AMP-acid ligase II